MTTPQVVIPAEAAADYKAKGLIAWRTPEGDEAREAFEEMRAGWHEVNKDTRYRVVTERGAWYLKGWLAFVVARKDTRGDVYEEWVDIQGEAWYLSVGERVAAGDLVREVRKWVQG